MAHPFTKRARGSRRKHHHKHKSDLPAKLAFFGAIFLGLLLVAGVGLISDYGLAQYVAGYERCMDIVKNYRPTPTI